MNVRYLLPKLFRSPFKLWSHVRHITSWQQSKQTVPSKLRGGHALVVRLGLENLEQRLAPASVGTVLSGTNSQFTTLLSGTSIHYTQNGTPDPAYLYQVPGTVPGSGAQNVNQPYAVNFVNPATATQAVDSSDWWSNLMFRTDPSTGNVLTSPFQYTNAPMYSEPAAVEFIDQRWTGLDPQTGKETVP